jgi:hypothetical protein
LPAPGARRGQDHHPSIDAHVEAERKCKEDHDDDGTAGVLVPVG